MKEKRNIFVAATGNRHKMAEMTAVMEPFGIDLISKAEAGAAGAEPEETGATFEENAYIKAKAVLERVGRPVIADDSGLAADALNGAPGVRSARFSETGSDADNNAKLLELMEAVPDGARTAKFVSVVTLLYPDGHALVARGECAGRLLRNGKGENGFGYDPLFVPAEYDAEERTFAQLSPGEKNAVSHRARALAALREQLAAEKDDGKE
ncbi:MAG: RdgB/HAM1 family non-canonical purine NTP pyrophosphatase [Clostridiales Family XIII bacterium]|jgi:XTP/dITP diphosphohydrolase|nr:RdgB/HAM1 family non-canonical purine NTP pyrophosphatase [Clostridiales Family XIII bacterium]